MSRRYLPGLILAIGCGCSGGDGASPTGPSFGSQKSAASNLSAAAVSGVVADALDGRPLGGITVEIPGIASAVTGGDGAFNLAASALGSLPLVIRGEGFYVRETHVMLSGQPAPIDILPMGRDFDLDFFDHVFRDLGEEHTKRWSREPKFEIWTGVYDCHLGEYGHDCDDLVATGETAPGQFVQVARDIIAADAPKYTGGAIVGLDVTMREPHAAGTRLTWREYFERDTVRAILMRRRSGISFARRWPWESGAMYAATFQIDKTDKDEPSVYSHELAHTLGFSHPASHENVPLPSIMRDARAVTAVDELHGRILYRRPPGSRTADKDPEGFAINGLRAEAEAVAPDPALIQRVQD